MRNPFSRRYIVSGAVLAALRRDQIGWDHDHHRQAFLLPAPTCNAKGSD